MYTKRNRKLQRLPKYNYSNPGMYFVTICTKLMVHWFGECINGNMQLNEFGKIVNAYWINSTNHFENIILDEFVVMPNHIHGIVTIRESVGNRHACSLRNTVTKRQHQYLPNIIGSFKSATAKKIHEIDILFQWQKSYHDHIIRNEAELNRIRKYIRDNPKNWTQK